MSFATWMDRLADAGALMWRASWQASVLAVIVVLVQFLFGRHLPPRWRHAMWMLVLVRLCLPVVPQSRWSVFNLTATPADGSSRVTSVAQADAARGDGLRPLPGSADHPASSAAATTGVADPSGRYSNVLKNIGIAAAGTGAGAPVGGEKGDPHSNVLKNIRMRANGVEEDSTASVGAAGDGAASPEGGLDRGAPTSWAGTKPDGPAGAWTAWAAWLWLAGVVFLAARVAWATWRVSRSLRRLERVTDPEVLDVLAGVARSLRLRGTPVLLTGEGLFNPALVGFVRPRVIVPRELLDGFDAGELRLVFLHELAHLKRRDVATNWFATVVTILHWPNPVAWLAAWRLRVERELACDEVVLSHTAGGDADRRAYGETIVKLLETCARAARGASPAPLSAGGVGILEGNHQMKRRITMIARFARRSRSWAAVAAVSVLALAVVTLTDAVHGESPQPAGPRATAANAAAPAVADTELPPQVEAKLLRDPILVAYQQQLDALNARLETKGPGSGANEPSKERDLIQRKFDDRREALRSAYLAEAAKDRERAGAAAAVPAAGPAVAAPATQPDEFAIVVGDQVQVTVFDLEGPGKQTIKLSRVNRAGEITVPYVDKGIRVVGLGELEAQRAIEKAYVDARLIDNPHASVTVAERRMAPAAANPAAHGVIEVNELVTVSIMDLVGAGIETVKTSRVDDEGMISLPYVGRVKVAGVRPVDAEKAVAKAYKDQKLVNQAVVVVSLPGRGESHSLSGKTAPAPAAATSPTFADFAAAQADAKKKLQGQPGESSAGKEVRVYDVGNLVKDRTPGDDLRSAVGEVMQVIKVCSGPDVQATSFDTKIVVSAKPREHELIAETLKSLLAAGPSTQTVKAKERADAIDRATKLWNDKYAPRIIVVAGQDNYQDVAQQFAQEVEAMRLGIKGSDVPTRNPAKALDPNEMTVENMALVDPIVAKQLSAKQELEVQIEQLKKQGMRAENPRMKELQAKLEIHAKLLDDRVKWNREK